MRSTPGRARNGRGGGARSERSSGRAGLSAGAHRTDPAHPPTRSKGHSRSRTLQFRTCISSFSNPSVRASSFPGGPPCLRDGTSVRSQVSSRTAQVCPVRENRRGKTEAGRTAVIRDRECLQPDVAESTDCCPRVQWMASSSSSSLSLGGPAPRRKSLSHSVSPTSSSPSSSPSSSSSSP